MRCFSIQSLDFVKHCIKLFESGVDTISYENIDSIDVDDDFIEYSHPRVKPVYNGKDFIYMFVSNDYQFKDWRYNILSGIDNLNSFIWYFFHKNLASNWFCLMEFDIPEEDLSLGLFGSTTGNIKFLSQDELKSLLSCYEFVSPVLKKDWIVDFYTIKELPNIDLAFGAEFIPMNYTNKTDKLFYSNAPWVWKEHMVNSREKKLVAPREVLDRYANTLDNILNPDFSYERSNSKSKSDEVVVATSKADILNWCIEHKVPFKKFNQPVTIPDGVTSCACMFKDLESFNQPIVIPDSVTSCWGMFDGCKSFNSPVIIGNSVTDCGCMFNNCVAFNQPITIPDSVTNCYYMFNCCTSFNQPITIPDSVTSCSGMFRDCKCLNKSIVISNGVKICNEMFYGCSSFNKLVKIPESVTECNDMFFKCESHKQLVVIEGVGKSRLLLFKTLGYPGEIDPIYDTISDIDIPDFNPTSLF